MFAFLYLTLWLACLRSVGDLTKAMENPIKGTVPDLVRVGLDAPSKMTLLLGLGDPSVPSHADGEGWF
jgi:hypothetical protein